MFPIVRLMTMGLLAMIWRKMQNSLLWFDDEIGNNDRIEQIGCVSCDVSKVIHDCTVPEEQGIGFDNGWISLVTVNVFAFLDDLGIFKIGTMKKPIRSCCPALRQRTRIGDLLG